MMTVRIGNIAYTDHYYYWEIDQMKTWPIGFK